MGKCNGCVPEDCFHACRQAGIGGPRIPSSYDNKTTDRRNNSLAPCIVQNSTGIALTLPDQRVSIRQSLQTHRVRILCRRTVLLYVVAVHAAVTVPHVDGGAGGMPRLRQLVRNSARAGGPGWRGVPAVQRRVGGRADSHGPSDMQINCQGG